MREHNRGFTLIETMMVVAIMGILTVMAAPLLSDAIRHRNLDQVARGLTSCIYTARSKAILTRSKFHVDLNGNYFQTRSATTNQVVMRYPSDASTYLDPSISMSSTNSLNFNYSGSLVDGNGQPSTNVIVTLTDNVTSETLTITVVFTGGAKIARVNN